MWISSYVRILLCAACAFVCSVQGLENEDGGKSRHKRVIGGTKIGDGEWPWLVHLRGKIPTYRIFGVPILYKTYYCSASLLNERWLLTAAHCFASSGAPDEIAKPEHWHAKLGDVDSTHSVVDRVKSLVSEVVDEPGWKMWYFHAEEIIIHPLYDEADDWKHDIALVKMDADLPLTDDTVSHIIRPVRLPPQDDGTSYSTDWPQAGSLCIMQGWGCTQNGGAVSNIARSTILPILPREACIFKFISNTRLCAGYNFANSGICPGDSGGPLVCGYEQGNERLWVQAGVASYTSAIKPDSVPGVFTRVAQYTDWIMETAQNHEDTKK